MSFPDDQYIQRCLDGHPDEYRHLVGRYQRMVSSFLATRLNDSAAAEDLTQETFVRAYWALSKLRERASFPAWLLGIAQRAAQEHSRLRQRDRRTREAAIEAAADKTAASTSDEAPDVELQQALVELPEDYRKLVTLRYYGGQSCAQIAQQLQMPLGTVTKMLSRAYARLRQSLAACDARDDVRSRGAP
jgi:RNA polymerase sigma-70 factor, ECF subfamily